MLFYDNAKERKENCGGDLIFIRRSFILCGIFEKNVGEKVLAPSLILCYNLWDATDGAS